VSSKVFVHVLGQESLKEKEREKESKVSSKRLKGRGKREKISFLKFKSRKER